MGNHKKSHKLIVIWASVLIMIIILLFNIYQRAQYKGVVIKDIGMLHIKSGVHYDEYEDAYKKIKSAFEFLFIKEYLPVTNLQTFEREDTASGDDILSESLGLMMLISINENDASKFENLNQIMNQTFLKENGLLKWRVPSINDHNEIVNATIDDLRVVKALYEASELWDKPIYKTEAIHIGNALFEQCTRENFLTSYDTTDSPVAILTYYDFKAMLYLYGDDNRWENIILNGINEIYRQKIPGRPFFEIEEQDKTYRSIENLMILQHLYEVGLEDDESLTFIREQMNLKGYYAAYSKQGQVTDNIESPAIYGIIAQISKLADDEVLYHMACQKLVGLTNQNADQYAWAFVDGNTHVGYSFDHLMTLLGL